MSIKNTVAPFYETASRSINTPARDAVNAEAERREKQRMQELSNRASLTPEEDAELVAWQEAEMKKDAWILEAANRVSAPTPEQIAADERRFQEMKAEMEG